MTTEERHRIIAEELERGRTLLNPERVGIRLSEVPAEPSAEIMGALTAVGLKSDFLPVQGNLYVFAELDESKETLNRIEDETLPSGYDQVSAMSGVLVFLARARTNIPEGEAVKNLLDDMLRAFASE
jgi:hypothetical protein